MCTRVPSITSDCSFQATHFSLFTFLLQKHSLSIYRIKGTGFQYHLNYNRKLLLLPFASFSPRTSFAVLTGVPRPHECNAVIQPNKWDSHSMALHAKIRQFPPALSPRPDRDGRSGRRSTSIYSELLGIRALFQFDVNDPGKFSFLLKHSLSIVTKLLPLRKRLIKINPDIIFIAGV